MDARDQSASGAVADQLAVDFLAAEPRAGIAPTTSSRKPGDRCAALSCVRARVTAVRGSAISRLISGTGRGVVVTSWRGRGAEPQPELQHVEGRVGPAPLGELVAPGGVELRAAQLLRVLRREGLRHRAVAPDEPAPRRIHRGRARPRARQEAGRPLDHHLAHVELGLADQRDADDGSLVKGGAPAPARAPIRRPARVLPVPRPPITGQVVQ